MNKFLLKQMIILSVILGFALGAITIIPLIGVISFLAVMILASTSVLIYMKKMNSIGVITEKEGGIYGAIIGFVSFLGFCLSFVPLAAIIGWIYSLFSNQPIWYSTMTIWFKYGLSSILILLLMIVFVGALSALLNGFSGMATVFLYGQLKNISESDETLNMDIKQ